jgi:hypothetical protein
MELELPYGKTHDLLLLTQMLPNGKDIEAAYGDDLIALTHFATTAKFSTRAPNYDEIDRAFKAAPKSYQWFCKKISLHSIRNKSITK